MAEITLQAQIQSLRTAVEGNLATDDQPARTQLPWQPGERVTAVVESVRPNDRALLRVGDFVFDTKLPVPPQLGQRLNLTFVAAAPRVTFALPEAAEPVRARRLLLCARTLLVLESGLSLLGLRTLQRM